MKRVTIREIARRAGVSINTVSRALNNKPDVRAETRERILRIARELNYVPNRYAQALRAKFSRTLAVIVSDIANPFFGALIKGIERAAFERGFRILLYNTNEEGERELSAVQSAVHERVDGVLLAPVLASREPLEMLALEQVPFVLVGRELVGYSCDVVVPDDLTGGGLATRHLVEQGCRWTVHIPGPPHASVAQHRQEGYLNALEQAGIRPRPSWITEPALTMEDGYRVATMYLRQHGCPDGIFAFSDYVALGVLRALREERVSVPDRVKVVGYDDIDFASYVAPTLTTVQIPKEEMGKTAVELLCRRLERQEEPAPPERIVLPVRLCPRETTQCS